MSIIQDYDLPPFSAVELSSGIEAQIGSGLPQRVSVEASDPEALDRLKFEVHGGTLYISRRHDFFGMLFFGSQRLLVSVTAPEIKRVVANSGSDAHFVGSPARQLELEATSGSKLLAESLDVDRLMASTGSGSKLVLAGRCGLAELDSRSGSSLEARDLDCAETELSSSSGSSLSAKARDAARIDASSGSSVRLRSRPARVDQHSDGGSSIRIG